MQQELSIKFSQRQFFILMIGISCLLHAFFFFFNHWPDFSLELKQKQKYEPLKVTTIDREEWNRLRTVGKKDGKKDIFSVPLSPKTGKTLSKMDFKSLKVSEKAGTATIVVREEAPQAELKKIEHDMFSQQRPVKLNQAQLSNMPIAIGDAMLLENTDFNIGITPPAGVNIDQLNSMEKIYYGFQKRTFESYVNSFLSSYQKVMLERPLLKKSLMNSLHQMTGRIVFDSQGNIISIKIIKSSLSDDVHELFEKTLLSIGKLPNPPKSLLNDKGELTIYYQLNIN